MLRLNFFSTAAESTTAAECSVDQLEAMLRSSEDAFVALFEGMAPAAQLALGKSKSVNRLLATALAHDRPHALMLLRPLQPRSPFWQRSSYSDAVLVDHVQHRHPQPPELSVMLYQRGLVSRQKCVAALRGATFATLKKLAQTCALDTHIVADAASLRAAPLSRWALCQLRHAGLLAAGDFARLVSSTPGPVQNDELRRDITAGRLTVVEAFPFMRPAWPETLAWVRAGLLPGDVALARFSNIEPRVIRELYAHRLISWDAYFSMGVALPNELLAQIAQGTLTPQRCASRYAMPGHVLRAWYEAKTIAPRTYLHASAQAWQRSDFLPILHLEEVRAATDINATLLTLPKPVNARLRRTFVQRLHAEFIVAKRASAAAPKAAPVADAQAPAACLACLMPFDKKSPGLVFSDCRHPPHYHAACLREDFRARAASRYLARCPSPHCGIPTGVQHGMEMGLDAQQLDRLAVRLIESHKPALWMACPTDGCCNGAVVSGAKAVTVDCAHCDHRVTFRGLAWGFNECRDVLVDMINGMGCEEDVDVLRGCYHCGTATLKTGGCRAMRCGDDTDAEVRPATGAGCGRSWDFSNGRADYPAVYWTDGRQCYVPKNGEMLRAGLYAPLPPGFIHVAGKGLPGGAMSIQDLVIGNARAKGWIRWQDGPMGA